MENSAGKPQYAEVQFNSDVWVEPLPAGKLSRKYDMFGQADKKKKDKAAHELS